MAIYLKDKIKIDKTTLLEGGKKLKEFLNDGKKLNDKISEYNTSKGFIFDDPLEVYLKDLNEALTTVTEELGKLELESVIGGKK